MQGGTALLLQTTGTGVAVMSFAIAGMNWGNALTKSIQLSAFSVVVLAVLAPVLKRAYGKDWVFAAPGALVALEAGQAAVFLTTPANDPQTWAALLFQLGFSFFKNTGMYLDVKVKVKALLGIQMTQEQLSEKRTDLAIIGNLKIMRACEQRWLVLILNVTFDRSRRNRAQFCRNFVRRCRSVHPHRRGHMRGNRILGQALFPQKVSLQWHHGRLARRHPEGADLYSHSLHPRRSHRGHVARGEIRFSTLWSAPQAREDVHQLAA